MTAGFLCPGKAYQRIVSIVHLRKRPRALSHSIFFPLFLFSLFFSFSFSDGHDADTESLDLHFEDGAAVSSWAQLQRVRVVHRLRV